MHRSRRQRGIALILVLWIMVLLTLMAAGFAFERRTDAVLAIDQIEAIEADALAEAAIARAVLALKQDDVELQPIPDGRIYPWRYAGRELRFAVVSENGKIDLNGAREELIHGLFSSLVGELEDFDQAQADALADAVLDWRDRDSDTRPSGAEDDDYRAAGYEYESADAPFVTIGELLRIKGMTEPVYSRVSDAVTVYTRSGQIDPLSAPRRALLAVPDTEAGLADKVIEARNARQSVLEPIPELRSWFGDGARFLTTGRPQTFS
ncbi:MAG: general secretion pathway protein GspK, partial [Gammaproteobacteria bacterium]|nr:general secretion pathway protein GspK [Gammaproteobacteria bacterium]